MWIGHQAVIDKKDTAEDIGADNGHSDGARHKQRHCCRLFFLKSLAVANVAPIVSLYLSAISGSVRRI